MKFTLEIELGNDAMRTYEDIAKSVRLIFSDFSRRVEDVEEGEQGRIYDTNGNRVGVWEVKEEEGD